MVIPRVLWLALRDGGDVGVELWFLTGRVQTNQWCELEEDVNLTPQLALNG
jgi:hypothetical protein